MTVGGEGADGSEGVKGRLLAPNWVAGLWVVGGDWLEEVGWGGGWVGRRSARWRERWRRRR
jgi:hypothetical protein